MLNGQAPIIIFTFPIFPKGPFFNAIAGIPLIGDVATTIAGIPIPIYLDENRTGIVFDSGSKALDIETTVEARDDAGKPDVRQRGLNNIVTVNLKADKQSTILAALLALNDMVFQRVVSKEYSVTYLNGPTTVFNGLLESFIVEEDVDTTLMRISMQISKANQNKPTPDSVPPVLRKVTGATPISQGA